MPPFFGQLPSFRSLLRRNGGFTPPHDGGMNPPLPQADLPVFTRLKACLQTVRGIHPDPDVQLPASEAFFAVSLFTSYTFRQTYDNSFCLNKIADRRLSQIWLTTLFINSVPE